jgi:3-hydroxybutyryl-CoA dehydrogenase
VAGLHFFNPPTILPLVEVVRSALSDPEVITTLYETARAWRKTPVLCASTPGFIVNRVARPFYGEALRLLGEQAADPATLDAVMREAGGFRMGPFELMDLIGHDVNFAVTRSVYEGLFDDPRYKPSTVQQELVFAGHLGRKSGRGFYDYTEGAVPPVPRSESEAPAPTSVIVEGDLGPAEALAQLAEAKGLAVERRAGAGLLRVGAATAALTDGRLASERHVEEDLDAVFDLALDYAAAPRVAVAFADQATGETRRDVTGLFQALGKTVSVLDDTPGLVVMRTVASLANEAAEALQQGIASGPDIDLSMRQGVNYPKGPLAWADSIGVGRVAAVIDNLSRLYGEDRYRVSLALRRRALAGGAFEEAVRQ